MWDELMQFVDPPSETEPTVEPQGTKAGGFNDDGSYEQYGTRPSRDFPRHYVDARHHDPIQPIADFGFTKKMLDKLYQQELNRGVFVDDTPALQHRLARANLEAAGFEIVENLPTTLFQELGGVIPNGY